MFLSLFTAIFEKTHETLEEPRQNPPKPRKNSRNLSIHPLGIIIIYLVGEGWSLLLSSLLSFSIILRFFAQRVNRWGWGRVGVGVGWRRGSG